MAIKYVEPTAEDMLEEDGLKEVSEKIIEETRWGVTVETIYYRANDNTHWAANYRRAGGDGEEHGLRDDEADIYRVQKARRTIDVWERVRVGG